MNGIDASIVGPDETVPGYASRAKARSDGSAPLSDSSAGEPTRSTRSSAGIVRWSASSSRANAAAVVLKLVTRFLSVSGLRASALNTLPWPLSSRWMSLSGSSPSEASAVIAEFLYAASQYCIDAFSASAPP